MRRLLVLVVVLAAVWTGAWFALTGVLRQRFESALALARAEGWDVVAGTPARAGFPLAAAISVPDVAASGGAALPGAGRVTAPRLVVAVTLAHPLSLTMTLPQGFTDEEPGLPPVTTRATTLVGTAPLLGPPRLTVDATNLVATAPGGPVGAVGRLHLVLTPQGPDLGFDLDLAEWRLPPGPWALGPVVTALRARGEAAGALAAPPANGVRGIAGWVQDWHDRGGRLTLASAALDWGTLAVTGHGAMALDAALQPDATLAVHIEGYDGALAALVRAGDMARGPALAAQFALGMLARGDKPGIDVNASLRQGRLTVGGVSLGRVPEIIWPSGP